MTRIPLSALDGQSFDIAVIGAGAVGCSVAQHLVARGYKVTLLDQGDIASGTSSRSSRLLYCGLAYFSPDYALWRFLLHPRDLFQKVRLARQAMRCRTELAVTMPERLERHPFFFPILRNSDYPVWKVALGYRALSLFGSRKAPLGYHRLNAQDARAAFGAMALMPPQNLIGAAVFDEYQYAWPERIVTDTALDARRMGCTLRTYTEVTDMSHDVAGWHIELAERAPRCDGTARITAKFVVNAAGPWVDRLHRRISNHTRQRMVGIKGINLVVKLPEACHGQGFETISSLNQPFYLMPWGDHHFFGPTETLFQDEPGKVRVERDEVEYILGEANRLLPVLNLSEADVVYRWAGVRPHTASRVDPNAAELTIHDMAKDGLPDMLAITGCPIMTHRHAGRKTAAKVARRLRPSGKARTLSYRAQLMPDAIRTQSGLSAAEIRHAAQNEEVVTLCDLVQRRLPAGWRPDLGLGDVDRICAEAAPILGWDHASQSAEIAAYRAYVTDSFEPNLGPANTI